MKRVLNFYPGPSALPVETLEQAQRELLDWRGTGMSVLEISHRSKEYIAVHEEAIALLRGLYGIPEDFHILLLQGGAALQFAMIPMNLLGEGESADYIVTGRFSRNAYETAKTLKKVHLAASTEVEGKYFRIPKQHEIHLGKDSVYCHLTSNNTIFGTQWGKFPHTGEVPIVADMSSDILSRRLDFSGIGLIYAGAQKNLGPAGVTVVIIRDDLLKRALHSLPDVLSYRTLVQKNSLYNTPCCFCIYMMRNMLRWVEKKGGLDFIDAQNKKKAEILYTLIENNPSFFLSRVEKQSRSYMNITFNLTDDTLEARFVEDAASEGIIGIKGHRSVGGIRISIYNSHGVEDIERVADFMRRFANKHA